MIQLPRRSVTRFFIPLIDVMTLLFCIFLLMPMVKNVEPVEGGANAGEPLPKGIGSPGSRGRDPVAEAIQERLDIQVLEINGSNGKLFSFAPGPVEIDSQAKARQLIAERKKKAAGKEVYFLLLYPRQASGYPEEGQVQEYARWFADVPHKIDNPRSGQ